MRLLTAIRDNFRSAVKLFVNQIGIAIFAFVLYTAVTSAGLEERQLGNALLFISIGSLLFYAFLIYSVIWEIGAKDRIRVDSGRGEKTPGKGVLIGALAYLPNLVWCGIGLILGAVAMKTGGEGVSAAFAFFHAIMPLSLSPYAGVILNIFPTPEIAEVSIYFSQSVLYTVFPLFTVLVSAIGYHLGYLEWKLIPNKKKN